jgi:hypothetical protein
MRKVFIRENTPEWRCWQRHLGRQHARLPRWMVVSQQAAAAGGRRRRRRPYGRGEAFDGICPERHPGKARVDLTRGRASYAWRSRVDPVCATKSTRLRVARIAGIGPRQEAAWTVSCKFATKSSAGPSVVVPAAAVAAASDAANVGQRVLLSLQ